MESFRIGPRYVGGARWGRQHYEVVICGTDAGSGDVGCLQVIAVQTGYTCLLSGRGAAPEVPSPLSLSCARVFESKSTNCSDFGMKTK
jgi:hypothetical protein